MQEVNASDFAELQADVRGLNDRLSSIEHRAGYVASAFPKNDLGKPDYDGHRKSHILMINDANIVAGYKQSVTKQVLSIIVTAIVTLLLAGVVSYFNAHSLPITK